MITYHSLNKLLNIILLSHHNQSLLYITLYMSIQKLDIDLGMINN